MNFTRRFARGFAALLASAALFIGVAFPSLPALAGVNNPPGVLALTAGSGITITGSTSYPTISSSSIAAIGLTSGTGYPTASGTIGDIYRATDGGTNHNLYSFVGTYTGLPTVVNTGCLASTATTGSPTVTMERATTPGNILVAMGSGTNSASFNVGGGWTSIIFSNGNSSGLAPTVAWQSVGSSSSTVTPFTASNPGPIHVFEIANANGSGTIVGSAFNATTYGPATAGNLMLHFRFASTDMQTLRRNAAIRGCVVNGQTGAYDFDSWSEAFPVSLNPGLYYNGSANNPGDVWVEIKAAGSGSVNYWKSLDY